MELTINKIQKMSSEEIFYAFTNLFLHIYDKYKDLKISRSDFKIFVTSIIEISKENIDNDDIDNDDIESYFKSIVEKSLEEYESKKVVVPNIKTPKAIENEINIDETQKKCVLKNINDSSNKKILKEYIKNITVSKKINDLILIFNDLESFIIKNNFVIDSNLYNYLIEKNKIIYNLVEMLSDCDLEKLINKYKISNFIIKLIEYFFEYNNACESVSDQELEDYDSVKIYLKELPSKILSREEEIVLFKKYKSGDLKAREKIIKCNLRLVVSIAKKYSYSELPFLEIISEGNIGLMKALDKFNPELGMKFSTYATWWIRQNITRSIANNSKSVRIPVHVCEKIYKIKKLQDKLKIELGRDATIEELAEYANLPTEKVRELLEYSRPVLSLNTPIKSSGHKQEESENEFGFFIESEVDSPVDMVEKTSLIDEIDNLYRQAGLIDREIEVLNLRYGRVDGYLWTLEELGKKYGITRERVRQIENKGLKKLRKCRRTREYAIYMDEPDKALSYLLHQTGKQVNVDEIPIEEETGSEPVIEEQKTDTLVNQESRKIESNAMVNLDEGSNDDMPGKKRRKSIYELFSQYTKDEVFSVLKLLKDEDVELLYRRDGYDLDNPNQSLELNEADYNKFYGVVRPRIKKLLEKNYGKRESNNKRKPRKKNDIPENLDVMEKNDLVTEEHSSDRYKQDVSNVSENLQVEIIPTTGLEPVEDQEIKLVNTDSNEQSLLQQAGKIPAMDKTINHSLGGVEAETKDNDMSLNRANAILEVLNMPTFNQIYQVLGAKDAVIISLALGKVDGKFFEASKIATFLGMTEEEVNESVKRILEVYKTYLVDTINQAITVVSSNPKVLEKINNNTGLND